MADLDIYRDKIAQGTMSWDDAADMFLGTVVGQSSGENHAGVLARLRAHFADEAALNAWLQRAYSMVPAYLKPKAYRLLENGTAIQCLTCNMISYSPNDVAHRFCGRCKRFHDQENR